MKKIYTIIGAIAITSASIAQSGLNISRPIHTDKVTMDAKTKARFNSNNVLVQKVAGGPFITQIDPIEQVMTQKTIDITSASPQEDIFISGIHQDSVTKFSSSSSTRQISDIFAGTVMDPRSIYLQASYTGIVSNADSYTLDSLFILGSYRKVTADVDTLYTYVVWSDTTATNVFTKMNTTSVWVAPISTWRKSLLGPKVTGAVGASGNKVKAGAPATNMRLIKYVLTNQDSVGVSGRIRYIGMSVGAPIVIPAGNVVSAFFTFAPGGTYTGTDISYSLGGSAQTVNGFAYALWSQSSPAVAAVSDYVNYQVDPTTLTMGVSYDKNQRHAKYSATFNNNILGDLTTAPVIVYSIYGNSTVSVKELEANGVLLGQNVPNPSNGESTVSYKLAKDVSSVVFTVTDVMGRVISSEKTSTTAGVHTVKLNSYSAGIYYYTINVDGKSATKKMIVQ